jgi:hypothetical protein
MLPEHHHTGDTQWLQEQFSVIANKVHPKLVEKVAHKYSMVYLETFEASEPEHRKDGLARRAANIRLREYVSNLTGKAQSLFN